jgi:ribosomal protein S6--L-glutamate ligase
MIVAGRAPGPEEESSVKKAQAIILPQGVRQDLYNLCTHNCERVFPNYDSRFESPGKIGDILLFRSVGVSHPKTHLFNKVADYYRCFPLEENRYPFPFPFVLKGNFGGEGSMVHRVGDVQTLQDILALFEAMERSGMQGFIVQRLINHSGRDLRVVVLYDHLRSYWRVQTNPHQFLTNLSVGGTIDLLSDPHLLRKAERVVSRFCRRTGINLAGIDVVFDKDDERSNPLLLEINYWFGRRFFGSSEAYYVELKAAVKRWLASFEPKWAHRIR